MIHCVNATCMKPREILFTENNNMKFTVLKSTEMFIVKEIQLFNKFFQTNACQERRYCLKIDGLSARKKSLISYGTRKLLPCLQKLGLWPCLSQLNLFQLLSQHIHFNAIYHLDIGILINTSFWHIATKILLGVLTYVFCYVWSQSKFLQINQSKNIDSRMIL